MERCFSEILLKYQKEIERELKKLFQEKISRSEGIFEKEILNILEEFSLRPAKRIRPVLVNIGYLMAGGKDKEAIMKASIFMELIHSMLLIHDDIMDQDKFRRGGKTMQYVYGGGHYGQSMALVAGDISGFLGHEILASSNFPAENKLLAIEKLNQVLIETGFGQMLEMQIRKDSLPAKKDDVLEVYRLKTALYSFVAPLQIGALLAGAKDEFLKGIEKFAIPVGLAFQIQDDFHDNDSVSVKEDNRGLVQKYIDQAREVITSQKGFPGRERQFLLDLVNYIEKGEY